MSPFRSLSSLLLALVAAFALCTAAKAQSTEVVSVDLQLGGVHRTLLRKGPSVASSKAIVWLVPGSGCVSFKDALHGLSAGFPDDFSFFLVDKPFPSEDPTNCSPAFHQWDSFDRRVQDEIEALRIVLADVRKANPVLLLGVSEGGLIAGGVAVAVSEISHLAVAGSGGGWSIEDELIESVRRGGLQTTEREVRAAMKAAEKSPQNTTHIVLGHSLKYWHSHVRQDFKEVFKKTGKPLWIAHGEADSVVPAESAKALHAWLAKQGIAARLSIFPAASHALRSPEHRYGLLWSQDLATWLLEDQKSQRSPHIRTKNPLPLVSCADTTR